MADRERLGREGGTSTAILVPRNDIQYLIFEDYGTFSKVIF